MDGEDALARLPGIIQLLGEAACSHLVSASEADELAVVRAHIEEADKALRQMIASANAAAPQLDGVDDAQRT